MATSIPPTSRPSHRPSSRVRRADALVGAWLPLVLAAAWGALLLLLLVRDPRFVVPFLIVVAFWGVPATIARRRARALLLGGDVARVIDAFAPQLSRAPHPETTQPLMIGAAYAAHGWTAAAREALGRARRGEAWATAYELRLQIETLIEAFDGDRRDAVRRGRALEALPLPPTGPFARLRILRQRAGLAALARAFARASRPRDLDTLRAAARANPLFHWAFAYAAAIVAIDLGAPAVARALLAGAPTWGRDSVFAVFHPEIVREITRLESERGVSGGTPG